MIRRFWKWLRPARVVVHYDEYGPIHIKHHEWRWHRR